MSGREKSERPGKGGPRRRGPPRRTLHRLLASLAVVTIVLLAAAVGGAILSGAEPYHRRPNTAVIVDQLSLTAPNPRFVESATDTLKRAGYNVDYYPGEEVTVDLYRDLQTKGYNLIIFRTHTSRALGEYRGKYYNEAGLWTSERYNTTAPELYEGGDPLLARVYLYEGAPTFTGITAGFVRSSMLGDFDGSTVIMMGCNGLFSDTTAQSFLDKGAEAAIGWDGDVSAAHTDSATERVLELLVLQGMTPEEAVAQAATEIGTDPVFGAELRILTGGR